jgi:hypothetical protein
MTYLDAAYHILHQAGRPLRYEEISGPPPIPPRIIHTPDSAAR